MTADLSSSLSLAGPELVVAVGALVILMLGAYLGEGFNRAATWLAALVLIVAGVMVIFPAAARVAPSAMPSSATRSRAS